MVTKTNPVMPALPSEPLLFTDPTANSAVYCAR